jgi:hypothetical protein
MRASLRERDAILRMIVGAIEPITDRRVFDPIIDLIQNHPGHPFLEDDGVALILRCQNPDCYPTTWPCRPLRDLAGRLRVRLP